MSELPNVTGLSVSDWWILSARFGEPAYRGRQIFAAIQHRRLRSFDEMSDLPKPLRERLSEAVSERNKPVLR